MRGRLLLFVIIIASLVMPATHQAEARILLKPNGSDAMLLWMRSISADVDIEGQFAETTLVMTFQNENDHRMEADFIYQLPPGAVATYFAYWAGDEKVVAKVVEKSKAAAIYSHITAMNRDPALIEMIGKNTFRARVFPVLPNQDLKVEVRIAQVLPSSPGSIVYTLPLADSSAPDPMDSVDVNMRIRDGADIREVQTNYGLPVLRKDGEYSIILNGENYRPPKDLNIRIIRKTAPLVASLYAAPSGGSDGFFALALTPDRSMKNVRASIRGISMYDVVNPAGRSVKAGESAVMFGRYKGSGKAVVTLDGRSSSGNLGYKADVIFGSAQSPENVASKLWAAARIASLGKSEKNRNVVIGLSKHFGMPSKFTSWLAVPKAEMIAYNRDRYRAKIDAVMDPLTKLIVSGKADSTEAKVLRTKLSELSELVGEDLEVDLKDRLTGEVYWLADDIAREENKRQPNPELLSSLKSKLNEIAKAAGIEGESYLKNAKYSYRVVSLSPSVNKLAELIAEGKGESKEAVELRSDIAVILKEQGYTEDQYLIPSLRSYMYKNTWELVEMIEAGKENSPAGIELSKGLEFLARETKTDPSQVLQDQMKSRIQSLSYNLVNAKQNPKRNNAEVKDIERKIKRLEDRSGYSAKQSIRDAERSRRQQLYWSIQWQIVELIEEGKYNTPQGQSLRKRSSLLAKELNLQAGNELKSYADSRISTLVWEVYCEKERSNPDKKKVASLETKIQRLENATGASSREYYEAQHEQFVIDSIENVQQRINAEVSREKPNRSRLDRLRKNLTDSAAQLPKDSSAVKDVKDYNQLLDETISLKLEMLTLASEIESARINGDKSGEAELTKRQAEVSARFDNKNNDLYYAARWGDPLISVEAPENAARVIALMPDGEIKTLEYNEDTGRWEARFDIPVYAPEGEYKVVVIVVLNDGTRKVITLIYLVDVTPPVGTPVTQLSTGNDRILKLTLDAGEDTSRVAVILPWGERLEMKQSSQEHRFYTAIQVPAGYDKETAEVTYILTDSAHNRTTLTVEAGLR